MKIVIGADHGGYPLKISLAEFIQKLGHEVLDIGAFNDDPSDYPDFARLVAENIMSGEAQRGVLICGSGVGASVAANKFKGIRASVCHDTYSAHQGVEDDDMNVLCLGARIIGDELAREIVRAYLDARFKNFDRYRRRLRKVAKLEELWMKKD
jgi:ribose 5-phosphate isomerase B